MNAAARKAVVYLIGAGASHGSVKQARSGHGILMSDLGLALSERLQQVIHADFPNNRALMDLANAVINENTDFEHVITFLDDSPSKVHRQFADKMKTIFQEVLAERLNLIRQELGEDPVDLYTALFDMYEVPGCPEDLAGIMTLNYDEYIEKAAEKVLGRSVDFGFHLQGIQLSVDRRRRLLKLHGSFGWEDTWPAVIGQGEHPLWIPPGIQKAKQGYPFNVLWGLAREMLSCDVLRIVGCKLGPNDWDLISLLFTSRHVNDQYVPYQIEIIDSPGNAHRLKHQFPYLEVRSIVEIEEIGKQIVGELIQGEPTDFDDLPHDQREWLISDDGPSANWFAMWLEQMAEQMVTDLGSVGTETGHFERLLQRG